MAHESSIAARWLLTTLTEAVPLPGGWHRGQAPQGTVFPYGIFDVGGTGDDENAAGGRVIARLPYLVKVVSIDGDQDEDAETALNRMDAALNGARATVSGQRIRVISAGTMPEEPEPGVKENYRHQGRFWQLVIGPE